jgi:dolichyl-phosphate-mannose-protein mannosyltransferase
MKALKLILLFAVLQLTIALLTYGFTLSFDESVWHYIGRGWFRYGLIPYSAGGVDNKSPLIFAIYGLSDKLFGVNYWFPRLLGTACQSVSLWYMYKLARHLAGKQAGLWAMQVYGLILMWHVAKGEYPSLSETYEVTCIIISFYIFVSGRRRYQFFLAGMLAGLGCAFRLTGLLSVVALVLASFRRNFLHTFLFGAGLLAGAGVVAGVLASSGVSLHDFMFYGFLNNLAAGSLTDHSLHWKTEKFAGMFLYSELVLLYPGVVAYLLMGGKLDLPILWAICAFTGICGIGMYDPGHLKDLLPSLALMNGIVIARVAEQYRLPVGPIAVILWVVFLPKPIEALAGFKALFKGSPTANVAYCEPPWPEPDNYARKKLAAWIKSSTAEQDRVFVAGYGAQVQVYSERLSPTVYFNADAMDTRITKAAFMHDLAARKPAMILLPQFNEYKLYVGQDIRDYLTAIVSRDYYLDRCMYNYAIYRIRHE